MLMYLVPLMLSAGLPLIAVDTELDCTWVAAMTSCLYQQQLMAICNSIYINKHLQKVDSAEPGGGLVMNSKSDDRQMENPNGRKDDENAASG